MGGARSTRRSTSHLRAAATIREVRGHRRLPTAMAAPMRGTAYIFGLWRFPPLVYPCSFVSFRVAGSLVLYPDGLFSLRTLHSAYSHPLIHRSIYIRTANVTNTEVNAGSAQTSQLAAEGPTGVSPCGS